MLFIKALKTIFKRTQQKKMSRFEQLKNILDAGQFFKIVCGAGNEDPVEVYRLSCVYTLAGALGIDVSANVEVVKACVRGIDKALEIAPALSRIVDMRPFITVSVGLKGDPHIRKARIITERCIDCGVCIENCEQLSIETNPSRVVPERCIGCGRCDEVCDADAIDFYSQKVDFQVVLPECLAAGAENLELHAIIVDNQAVLGDWQLLSEILPDQFISMCLDRSHLSNLDLIQRIQQAKDIAGERFIVQADGVPMSGGSDDFNTTLQAVACADIVQQSGISVKILLSGGTNSMTGKLAQMCGVKFHGISVGTFARNLVRQEISVENFDDNIQVIESAVNKAIKLVKSAIGE